MWSLENGVVTESDVSPEQLGLRRAALGSIRIDSPESSATMARGVLSGEYGPARDVVLMNASAALVAADVANDLVEGVELAARSIDHGNALDKLDALVELSGSLD